jgi:uncharacterized protein (TIGR02145 family)
MKRLFFLLCVMTTQLAVFSQETGTVTDPRDGRVYKTVKIDDQWIMAENLAFKPETGNYWSLKVYESKQNGSSNIIPDSIAIKKYGYTYDFETACNVAIPEWHLPTKDEWKSLFEYLGGNPKKVYSTMVEGGTSRFNAELIRVKYLDKGSLYSYEAIAPPTYWSSSKAALKKGFCICLVPPATRFNDGAARIGIAQGGGNVRLIKDK